MPKKQKIFTIGGATFDIFVKAEDQTIVELMTEDSCHRWLSFPYGAKVKVDDVMESFGGGATNTAVTFARQGLEAYFVGKIGEQYGDKVFENLKKEGVHCDFAKKTSRDKTGFSTIINTFDGDRTLLAYPGANRFFSAKDLPLEALATADWIFLNHLTEMHSKIPNEVLKILKKNPKIKLAWNPGHEQIMQGVRKWKQLLAHTEILFLNKEEAAQFTHTPYKMADPKKGNVDDVTDILKVFMKYGVKKAVITDGRNGSQASDGKYHYYCPVLSHRRVDTLGAGDAFASGFTTAMIKKLPLKTALLYGTLNAGNAVMHPGAQNGLLDTESMAKALKKCQIKVNSTKL